MLSKSLMLSKPLIRPTARTLGVRYSSSAPGTGTEEISKTRYFYRYTLPAMIYPLLVGAFVYQGLVFVRKQLRSELEEQRLQEEARALREKLLADANKKPWWAFWR